MGKIHLHRSMVSMADRESGPNNKGSYSWYISAVSADHTANW